jgi:hypothetical protein
LWLDSARETVPATRVTRVRQALDVAMRATRELRVLATLSPQLAPGESAAGREIRGAARAWLPVMDEVARASRAFLAKTAAPKAR